jgi:hypothetical protein
MKRKRAAATRTSAKRTNTSRPRASSKAAVRAMAKTASSPAKPVRQRVAAIALMPSAVNSDDASCQTLLALLRSREEPTAVRLEALQALQAASFAVVAFEGCRGDYVAALRAVAADPDLEVRQRVLAILARDKDRGVQKKLLDGLRDPAKALVAPEKALQLLSYDVHAEAYPLARAIVADAPSQAAKRQALRLLSADTGAAPLFEKLLRDKKETPEIRRMSATALHALRPEKLQAAARDIVLDDGESEDVVATGLAALTEFGSAAIETDAPLKARVARLTDRAPAAMKRTAQRFATKYERK